MPLFAHVGLSSLHFSAQLLDIVVFGRACANRIAEINKPGDAKRPLPRDAGEWTIANIDKLRYSKGTKSTAEIRLDLQKCMQNHAAVFREQKNLEAGCKKVMKPLSDFCTLSSRLILAV